MSEQRPQFKVSMMSATGERRFTLDSDRFYRALEIALELAGRGDDCGRNAALSATAPSAVRRIIPDEMLGKLVARFKEIRSFATRMHNERDYEAADGWVRDLESLPSATAATWIPVTERLPDDRGPWRVYGEDGQDVTTCHPSWWNTKDPRGSEFDGPEITHWMPLPEVPAPDSGKADK